MSAFVLNRNYQLQLPNSYVDVDREEMEYVDGGGSLTLTISIARALAMGAGVIAGAVVAKLGGAFWAIQAGRVVACAVTNFVTYAITNKFSSLQQRFTTNIWIPGNWEITKQFV